MGGAAFIFAEIAEPGVILHTGGPASITFGELDGHTSQRAKRLLGCCEQAGFEAELSASIKTVLWAKLAFICAQAGMTAAVRLPIGEIRTVDAAWARSAAWLPRYARWPRRTAPVPQAAQERALALGAGLEPGASPPCMTIWWPGAAWNWRPCTAFVVRRAAQHALAVPMSEAVYAILQPWAVRNQRASA
jgi:Ketopantoate reductase